MTNEGGAETPAKKSFTSLHAAPNLMLLTDSERDLWNSGYRTGYCHGVDRGIEIEREEVARLQRTAAQYVHALAASPTLGQDLSPEGAQQREQAGIDRFREDHARRRAEGGGRGE